MPEVSSFYIHFTLLTLNGLRDNKRFKFMLFKGIRKSIQEFKRPALINKHTIWWMDPSTSSRLVCKFQSITLTSNGLITPNCRLSFMKSSQGKPKKMKLNTVPSRCQCLVSSIRTLKKKRMKNKEGNLFESIRKIRSVVINFNTSYTSIKTSIMFKTSWRQHILKRLKNKQRNNQ